MMLTVRFWAKVEKKGPDECWLWKGAADRYGYGVIWYGGANLSAHRAAWLVTHDEEIPSTVEVHHKCRTRLCVNPAHLETLSKAAHDRERIASGNVARGTAHGRFTHPEAYVAIGSAKLTEKDVRTIVTLLAETDMGQPAIAKKFGVAVSMICHIGTGKAWRHLSVFPDGTTAMERRHAREEAARVARDAAILADLAAGLSQRAVAAKHGISDATVCRLSRAHPSSVPVTV